MKYIITKRRVILPIKNKAVKGFWIKPNPKGIKHVKRSSLLVNVIFPDLDSAQVFLNEYPYTIITPSFLTKYNINPIYFDYYKDNHIMYKPLTSVLHKPPKLKDDDYEQMALLYLKRAILSELKNH